MAFIKDYDFDKRCNLLYVELIGLKYIQLDQQLLSVSMISVLPEPARVKDLH